MKKEKIVVLGGGFAGLNFVKHIDKKKFDVVLVDRNNFHSFPPLFYQIASSGIEPGSICFPFRREMRKGSCKHADFRIGEVEKIDFAKNEIVTQYETISYDRLVIAAGTTNNFFNNPDLVKYVYTLKSTAQALRCNHEILDRLERASICQDATERRKLLSFVVIGGGPAGVEIAGALGEMKRYIIPREYKSIPVEDVSITLFEGAPQLLSAMSEKAQKEAKEYLEKLLVDVKLNHLMSKYENDVVTLDDGQEVQAGMVIWTAGVTGQPLNPVGVKLAPGARFKVDEFNRVENTDNVYALGDIAYMANEQYPKGMPQLAQVAIQQGINLAKNINRGKMERKFEYNDKGTMATVGRNLAVADLNHNIHLSGRFAWLTWMFVHLISILGMRNKLTVLIDWIWAYFSYGTSLRLLLHTSRFPLRKRWGEK